MKSFLSLLAFGVLSFLMIPATMAGHLPLRYFVPVVLRDVLQNPITTAQDIRVSLWARSDVKNSDITGAGAINTGLPYYGAYQATFTITPDGNGYFVPVTYGLYNIFPEDLAGFPATITPDNAYLQVEFKAQGVADTAYVLYDFGNSGSPVTRYLLDESFLASDINNGQGTDSDFFIIDTSDSSADQITLQFGDTLSQTISWNIANVSFDISGSTFVLDADNPGAGVNIDIVAAQGSDPDGVLRYDATANQWQMSNDGAGFVPFAGWHGSQTRIRLTPSDFGTDDADDNMILSADGSETTNTGTADAVVTKAIPLGYRATQVMIFGSDTANTVDVFANSISNGTTATALGSGVVGTEVNITDVDASETTYLSIFVNVGSGDQVFGGYITIVPIP